MNIKILWPWELPDQLEGIAVVCDVWGATTNINALLMKKVTSLFIVNSDNAVMAKEKNQNALVIGESLQLPKTFFDSSNYPLDVKNVNADNRVVLFMSNNGSRVIELVLNRKPSNVFTVSFSNIQCIYQNLKFNNEVIYLIPSGDTGTEDPKVLEDLLCVQTLKNMLNNEKVELISIKNKAKDSIKKVYGHQEFDQNENFKAVFETENLNVVPVCEKSEFGLIEIRNTVKNL